MGLAGSGTGFGSGIIPVGVNQNSSMQFSSGGGGIRGQQQEIMNAESGSTAFTNNQRNFQVNQVSQPQTTQLTSVSSPPSTSQTGGGGSSVGQPGNQNHQ